MSTLTAEQRAATAWGLGLSESAYTRKLRSNRDRKRGMSTEERQAKQSRATQKAAQLFCDVVCALDRVPKQDCVQSVRVSIGGDDLGRAYVDFKGSHMLVWFDRPLSNRIKLGYMLGPKGESEMEERVKAYVLRCIITTTAGSQ